MYLLIRTVEMELRQVREESIWGRQKDFESQFDREKRYLEEPKRETEEISFGPGAVTLSYGWSDRREVKKVHSPCPYLVMKFH
ncbi:hypothetical protein TNIN_281001 [Trichonephila inaurata madagascariensis]|uniref:Uncharacterized protein n=1 Tax=Trichonephila inaurata madagascariensis TaxID=2747483 RepID=A0A8X6XJM7_9ARAC|nr:hypothetical protein TNIN_281001 [Trichonephila inaurata madagascariensis]